MPSQAQRLVSFFRNIVLAAEAALLITSAALLLPAQNSVPASARQAATMPQFAARLAHGASRVSHPAQPHASYKNPTAAFARTSRGWMPQPNELYDNGPINGTTDAWTINSGFVVSDTFLVSSSDSGSQVNGMTFGAWVFLGDVLQSVEISITSSEFGGTTYFDGVVNFTQSGCSSNQYGFNVCTETNSNFSGPNLTAGTYWVNLQNAVVNDGDPVYWDENSGIGCESEGCPSLASASSVGTIPSEAFTVLGGTTSQPPPTCFQSQGNLQIIYNSGDEDGVTIDRAGNLYGVFGGINGLAFRLAHYVGWVFEPLFSFLGGYNGGPPNGAIIGPNQSLYGGAQGGIQNCGSGGSQYCGLVFNLTPQPTTCRTAICSWNENVPYRFSSENDGAGTINVSAFDQEGNLYGTTSAGGTFDAGTVFELMPSGGGWTKTTLYSFTGANDGTTPTQVLVGNDGNLYGVAGGGMFGDGVVFQLTPSGGGWTEGVLHAFSGFENDGSNPGYLVQDSAGNLYGIVTVPNPAAIFVLEKTSSGRTFSEYIVMHGDIDYLNNLGIDAAGNVYGTGVGIVVDMSFVNYIFKASYNGGWHYQDLDLLENQFFQAGGSLAVDTSGNLYGTTSDCGTNNSGTVWQFSP